jgi:ribose/xylose/arabinose/galactoside ABC-type transport system permease subunit
MIRQDDPATPVTEPRALGGLPPLRAFALMVGTLIGLYVCYLLVTPFLAALAWALTLSVLAAPVHDRRERTVRRPNLAATISVLLLAFIVILPVMLLGQQLFGGDSPAWRPCKTSSRAAVCNADWSRTRCSVT